MKIFGSRSTRTYEQQSTDFINSVMGKKTTVLKYNKVLKRQVNSNISDRITLPMSIGRLLLQQGTTNPGVGWGIMMGRDACPQGATNG